MSRVRYRHLCPNVLVGGMGGDEERTKMWLLCFVKCRGGCRAVVEAVHDVTVSTYCRLPHKLSWRGINGIDMIPTSEASEHMHASLGDGELAQGQLNRDRS